MDGHQHAGAMTSVGDRSLVDRIDPVIYPVYPYSWDPDLKPIDSEPALSRKAGFDGTELDKVGFRKAKLQSKQRCPTQALSLVWIVGPYSIPYWNGRQVMDFLRFQLK